MMGNLAIPLVEHAGFIQFSCLEAPDRLGGYRLTRLTDSPVTSSEPWTIITKLNNHTYP